MNRVMHFEIPADDTKRAKKFYEDVFGWEIKQWEGEEQEYWLITTGPAKEPGINGAIMKRMKPNTHEGYAGFICTVTVSSLNEASEKVKKAGGKVVSNKMDIPKIGSMHYCQDTEMNTFGILQPDMEAMKKMAEAM